MVIFENKHPPIALTGKSCGSQSETIAENQLPKLGQVDKGVDCLAKGKRVRR
ncbi:DUF2200 family protein [Streptococcus pseudoporcinus]|uniref:Uncharacterized protein n=1 Tax=Streptococcus pseudoporcinus LQ 940-04 TaxID=875093 RepID=G5K9Y5_9STRE|nr:DUF2200 family protein [Streptococcus pseudoporcinus]EFR43540.1 hypothetical protein HMPREF9320_1192 [Streptococcus pseudoporcinus SPIN 20026]EHI64370.1 hypothetical protein STRPS_0805 [Streptococcus pseudoporcinus LQ 940-04]